MSRLNVRISWTLLRYAVFCCFAAAGGAAAAADSSSAAPSACVFPLQPSNISAGDATMITDALRMKLSAGEGLSILDKEKSLQAWLTARHGADSICTGADCFVAAGDRAGVRYAIGGTIGRIGTLYTFSTVVYDVKGKKRCFIREYEYNGTIEEFYSDVPRRVANDITTKLPGAPAGGAESPAVRETARPAPVIDAEHFAQRPAARIEGRPEADRGIVQGPTIGASGRVAIGSISSTQSRWGSSLFFLYPTGKQSHLRAKFGAPLSGSDTMFRDYSRVVPDLYASIEHEWGLSHFGIGVGIAVTRMQAFTKTYYLASTYYDANGMIIGPGNVPVHFKENYSFNWVATLRGGKPNTGFLGRISWPMPINPGSQNLENSFFEYSALGVFGSEQFKGGLGLQGMIKNRTSVEEYSGGGYYYSPGYYNRFSVDDSYILAPCGKFAFLVGKQSVVCASIDLGSILFPRPDNESWWAPNLQIDYTFSIKPLSGPNVLDGTF
jgi:hypothetical protein